MIKFTNTEGNSFSLPTCWGEVLWVDYLNLKANNQNLFGVPADGYYNNLEIINQVLSFMLDIEIPYKDFEQINIQEKRFGSFVLATTYINRFRGENEKGKTFDFEGAMLWVLATYLSKSINPKVIKNKYNSLLSTKIVDTYSLGNDLMKQIFDTEILLNNHFKEFTLPKKSEFQNTGVENLQRYLYYQVIDDLARSNILDHDSVEKLSLSQVVLKLLYDTEKAYYHNKIQENYMKNIKNYGGRNSRGL